MRSEIHKDLKLRKMINARGTYTPFGVSRSSDAVASAVAQSLKHYFDMSELAEVAGNRISEIYGVESVAFSHCAAGSITMAIAAILVGSDLEQVLKLPDTNGAANRVVIQAGHLVNYGHPIEQDVRVTGAEVVVAGSELGCSAEALDAALSEDGVCALLCVESRLCKSGTVPTSEAVALAHGKGLPVIIDAAAQDLRLDEVIGFGADLTICSAQKYLSAPTCGLALGRRSLTDAMQMQEKGIGRAMKPTKEGIIGTLAAVEERASMDMDVWTTAQKQKSLEFADLLNRLPGVSTSCVPDQTGLPFTRVQAVFDEKALGKTVSQLNQQLAESDPQISVQEHELGDGVMNFEIVGLDEGELKIIYERLSDLLG